MPFPQRGIVLLAAAIAYLTAATVPCAPGSPGRWDPSPHRSDQAVGSNVSAGHHDHPEAQHGTKRVHGAREDQRGAFLTAPCPCGCKERSRSTTASKRLGPILLAGLEPIPVRVTVPGVRRSAQRPAMPPLHLPEPVPIAI